MIGKGLAHSLQAIPHPSIQKRAPPPQDIGQIHHNGCKTLYHSLVCSAILYLTPNARMIIYAAINGPGFLSNQNHTILNATQINTYSIFIFYVSHTLFIIIKHLCITISWRGKSISSTLNFCPLRVYVL